MADDEVDPAPEVATRRATAVFGGLMVLGGALVVVDALALPPTSAVVGPAAVPLPVGVLVAAVGALLLGGAVRGPGGAQALVPTRHAATAPPPAVVRVVALVAVLVAFTLVLPVLGWVVCGAALFVAAALLLGAPRGLAVVAYGWTLSAVVYLVFDRLIGLTLPAGPWGF